MMLSSKGVKVSNAVSPALAPARARIGKRNTHCKLNAARHSDRRQDECRASSGRATGSRPKRESDQAFPGRATRRTSKQRELLGELVQLLTRSCLRISTERCVVYRRWLVSIACSAVGGRRRRARSFFPVGRDQFRIRSSRRARGRVRKAIKLQQEIPSRTLQSRLAPDSVALEI